MENLSSQTVSALHLKSLHSPYCVLYKVRELTLLAVDHPNRLTTEPEPKCTKHSDSIPNQSQLCLHGFLTLYGRVHPPKVLSSLGNPHNTRMWPERVAVLVTSCAVCGTAVGYGLDMDNTARCSLSLIGLPVCHLH